VRSQGGRNFGGRRGHLGFPVALLLALGLVGAGPAAADTPHLSYAQAPEWIAPQTLGHYGTDPSSPGPGLTVDVPNAGGGKGWIEVWAQVKANDAQTAIGLFDVTGHVRTLVPGQDTFCAQTATPPLPADLFMTLDGDAGTYGTPLQTLSCSGTTGAPGPVLLHVTAGERRFRLEYADCGCGGSPAVSHRKLWIRPAPTR
jgi:hypothetical protein